MNSTAQGTVSSVLRELFQSHKRRKEKSYTLSEVSEHCHCNDCWIVVCNYVYDVTSFLNKHPGGLDVMMEHAGRDATVAFYTSGHQPETIELLEPYCIGTLAQNERVNLIGSTTSNGHSRKLWSEGAEVAVAD